MLLRGRFSEKEDHGLDDDLDQQFGRPGLPDPDLLLVDAWLLVRDIGGGRAEQGPSQAGVPIRIKSGPLTDADRIREAY
jgi:hypothetical protein